MSERYRAGRVNGTAVVIDQEREVVDVVIARCDIATDAEKIARALNTQGAVLKGGGRPGILDDDDPTGGLEAPGPVPDRATWR